MKWVHVAIIMGVCTFYAEATPIVFTTTGISTGNNLDNLGTSGSQVPVAEISGLNLTATFGALGGTVDYLNAIGDQLGVNSDLVDEGTSYFDTGEWLAVSFDKDVNVTRFKFASFTVGDSVEITWNTTILTLGDSDLTSVNEYFVDWDVRALDTIRFDALGKSAATSEGGFGIEEIDLSVVPEPATMAMFGIGGVIAFLIRRSACK